MFCWPHLPEARPRWSFKLLNWIAVHDSQILGFVYNPTHCYHLSFCLPQLHSQGSKQNLEIHVAVFARTFDPSRAPLQNIPAEPESSSSSSSHGGFIAMIYSEKMLYVIFFFFWGWRFCGHNNSLQWFLAAGMSIRRMKNTISLAAYTVFLKVNFLSSVKRGRHKRMYLYY